MDQKVEPQHTKVTTVVKPSRRKSILGSTIALLTLALLGWLAWHLTHQPAAPEGGPGARRGLPPTTVGVATVERADLPVIVEALGTVVPPAVATVRAQVSGVLKEVLFTEGQMVRAGQLLATIDPRQFEMALMQATGQRQRDEAQLQNAKLTLERYKTLLAQDSIARQDVDTQAALVKQLEGTVTVDRAVEGTAKLNLGYTRVTAPISGRVGLRAVDVGNVVSTSDANGIADITQVSPIDVTFALPQDLVPELQQRLVAGAQLPVETLDRGRRNMLEAGKFLALDNQVDTQTGTVKAKARFDNAKFTLFPNQFVNVRLLLRTIEGATVVPVTAMRHGNDGDFVYVLNAAERTVSLRPVKRGYATADRIQVTAGLQPGEQVITEGADRLTDGAKVALPGDKPSGAAGGNRRGRGGNGAQGGPGKQAAQAPQGNDGAQAATRGQPGERRRAAAGTATQ